MTVVWETTKFRDNFPRLGYAMPSGTVTASTAAAGYGAALAVNGDTFDAWKPTAVPAWLQIVFPAAQVVNYAGVAAHTIDLVGATVKLQSWNGSAFVDIPGSEVTPTNSDAIFWLINDVSTERVRLAVSGGLAEIGVFKVGKATTFTTGRRADYLGQVGRDARRVEYQDNMSVTGEKLGRSLRSDGLGFGFQVDHLPETWAAAVWPDLLEHCLNDDGLFLAPRPAQYPDECYWAWTSAMPTLERTLPNRVASRTLSMPLMGYKRPW
jgi:hypothetical protein